MNALFLKSLYKIAKFILVSYTGPQDRILLNLKILSNFIKLNYTTSNNGLFIIILSDFNARFLVWWTKGKTTEGTQLVSLTSVHVFHQLISQLTHLLPQSSSYLDLIFSDQPNLKVDSGVYPSLHSRCHHQITHCKLNTHLHMTV